MQDETTALCYAHVHLCCHDEPSVQQLQVLRASSQQHDTRRPDQADLTNANITDDSKSKVSGLDVDHVLQKIRILSFTPVAAVENIIVRSTSSQRQKTKLNPSLYLCPRFPQKMAYS